MSDPVPPDRPAPLDVKALSGLAPATPPGFYGEISFRYRDGRLVAVQVRETWMPPP